MSFLRQYLFAVRSFTRVPVTGPLARWVGSGPDALHSSAAHYPGVGWLVGVAACASFALVGLVLPDSPLTPVAAAAASIAACLSLTGASHEIALARAADAMAAGRVIGRDPGIGAHGTLALVLTVLAKVSLLAVIAAQSPAAVMAALLAGQVVSRFWPLLLGRGVPYIGEPPGAQSLALPIPAGAYGIAAAWSVLAVAIAWLAAGPGFAACAVIVSGVVLLGMRRLCLRRLHGFNEDALGAAQQLCEIGLYFGAALGLRLA